MSININSDSQNSRVLILSHKNIQNFVFNSCLYEFEDIIAEIDQTKLIAPPQYNFFERSVQKVLKVGTPYAQKLSYVNPASHHLTVEQNYDIFFTIIDLPRNLYFINSLKNWRKKCKLAVCYIIEIWQEDLPNLKNYLEFFQSFDLICLGHAQVVDDVSRITGRPCMYLPPGVNTVKFSPHKPIERPINLCSLGRRSGVTHRKLLELAEKRDFFYYYDNKNETCLRIREYQAHRTLIANLLKKSRYFITNHAKIDQPENQNTQEQMEIGYRFFEGAAAGSILLGCPPLTKTFKHYFDWDNAVIPLPFNSPNVDQIILELEQNPRQLQEISTNNIVNSLAKHDWVYRWEQVLNQLGIPPNNALEARKAKLKQITQNYLTGQHSSLAKCSEESRN